MIRRETREREYREEGGGEGGRSRGRETELITKGSEREREAQSEITGVCMRQERETAGS